MATQIYAVPDERGVIHVACGEDTLEIVVVQREAGGPRGGGLDDPQLAAVPTITDSEGNHWLTIDEPYVFASPGKNDKTELPHVDINFLLKHIRANSLIKTGRPHGVLLNVDKSMDLHQMSRLSSGLDRTCPGVGLAVDFGGRRD